jgi:hypothetical protein
MESGRLRVIPSYKDDEANTVPYTVLRMRTGGGKAGGIHGAHFGPGIEIRYAAADFKRQNVPWVEYRNHSTGESRTYLAGDAKPGSEADLPKFDMQCVDCHNRPTHEFDLPERAVDRALASGDIPVSLPYIKKKGVELLKAGYSSRVEAGKQIAGRLVEYYRSAYPDLYAKRSADVARAGNALGQIYHRNIFPDLNITWGTYLNNIGHTDSPGCFRCHDEAHVSSDRKAISQDCEVCHQMLAVEEASPEILKTLGLADQIAEAQRH